jgi:hypothetical protein
MKYMCDQIGTIHLSKTFGYSTMKLLYKLRVQPIGTSTRMKGMCKVQHVTYIKQMSNKKKIPWVSFATRNWKSWNFSNILYNGLCGQWEYVDKGVGWGGRSQHAILFYIVLFFRPFLFSVMAFVNQMSMKIRMN